MASGRPGRSPRRPARRRALPAREPGGCKRLAGAGRCARDPTERRPPESAQARAPRAWRGAGPRRPGRAHSVRGRAPLSTALALTTMFSVMTSSTPCAQAANLTIRQPLKTCSPDASCAAATHGRRCRRGRGAAPLPHCRDAGPPPHPPAWWPRALPCTQIAAGPAGRAADPPVARPPARRSLAGLESGWAICTSAPVHDPAGHDARAPTSARQRAGARGRAPAWS